MKFVASCGPQDISTLCQCLAQSGRQDQPQSQQSEYHLEASDVDTVLLQKSSDTPVSVTKIANSWHLT